MPATLELCLLGHFEARCGGQHVVVSNRRAQFLLAYLAMPVGRPHRREILATLLWDALERERGRGNLRSVLFELRRLLVDCGEVLRAHGDHLSLDAAAVQVDVADFEQQLASGARDALTRGVALYRGDFLDGLAADEEVLGDWLAGQRQRLRETLAQGLARLLAHQQADSDRQAAIMTAIRLLAVDPFQEGVHRTLIQLYAALGRTGAAIDHYRGCEDLFRRELGVGLEAETRAMYDQLRQARVPVLGRLLSSASAQWRETIAIDQNEAPLFGRAVELTCLRRAFEETGKGGRCFVVIEGPAGIGKTRLIAELSADMARRGARTLHGRAHETERMLPFGPWIDALRTADIANDSRTLAALGPLWRNELARLLPEIATEVDRKDTDFDQLRLFEGVAQLILAIAQEQPCGVLLDDLQWADGMSLRLLAYLAHRRPAGRYFFAVGIRDEEPSDGILGRLIAELQRDQKILRLALPPLSRTDTMSLVAALAQPDDDLGDRIWAASEGNPFMAIEMARALGEDVVAGGQGEILPLRVREVIAARLARLGETGRQLVAAAAVIGRDFEFDLLRRVARQDETVAIEGAEELVRRRVLRHSGALLDFTHGVIRQVAYDELLPSRRKLLHRRTADALEGASDGTPGRSSAAIARHFLEAERWDKAARYTRAAGEEAVAHSAYREALAWLEQALAIGDRLGTGREAIEHGVDVRLDLFHALLPLGQPARLIGILQEAENSASAAGLQDRCGWIAAYRANCLWLTGEPVLAAKAGERAVEVASALGDFGLRIVANFFLGQAYFFSGRYRDAVGVLEDNTRRIGHERARERFRLPGIASAMSHGWLCWSLAELGEFEAGAVHGQRALEIAEAAEHPFTFLDACRELGYLYVRQGDLAQAAAVLERGLALAQSPDLALWLPSIGSALGYAYALAGRSREGLELLENAVEQASKLGIVAGHSLRVAWLSETRLLAGDFAESESLARQALDLSLRHHERGNRAWVLYLMGEIALRRGTDPASVSAAKLLDQAISLAENLGARPLVARCRISAAEASAQQRSRNSRAFLQ